MTVDQIRSLQGQINNTITAINMAKGQGNWARVTDLTNQLTREQAEFDRLIGGITLYDDAAAVATFVRGIDLPPPPPPAIIAANEKARVWGDPHYEDADGGRFDHQGRVGGVYNLLNDTGIVMNAEYKHYSGDTTVMGKIGFKLNGSTVLLDADSNQVVVNGQGVGPGESRQLAGGATISVSADGKTITVQNGEYTISVKDQGGYFDANFQTGAMGVAADGRFSGGLVGEGFDADTVGRNGKGAQGEGALKFGGGAYEVASLFSDPQALITNPTVYAQQFVGIPVDGIFVSTFNINPAALYGEISQGLVQQVLTQSLTNMVTNATLGSLRGPQGELDSKRMVDALILALRSGNIDLAFLLFSATETKSSNDVAKALLTQIAALQAQKATLSNAIAGVTLDQDPAKNAQKQLELQRYGSQAGDIATEMQILQTFLQDVMQSKRTAQEMTSNYLAAEARTQGTINANLRG